MTNWYFRKVGADTNGGTSASASPEKNGTDGATTNASTTFTAASGNFQAADVGKGICINNTLYRITARASTTSITLDRTAGATASGLAWAVGGARASVGAFISLIANRSAAQTGDTVYVGAGVYRETWNFSSSFASGVAVVGDVDGTHCGDVGEVRVTAYTTSATTAPAATTALTITTNAPTFSRITFVAGTGNPKVLSFAPGSTNTGLRFRDCTFVALTGGNTSAMSMTMNTPNVNYDVMFERCRLVLLGGITISVGSSATADYDMGVTFRNCLIDTTSVAFDVSKGGTNAFLGGGVCVYNCTIKSAGNPVIRTTGTSTTFPVRVENCLIVGVGGGTVLSATSAGQIVENYNILIGSTARSNVTAGANSPAADASEVLYSIGQEAQWYGAPRPYGVPTAGSALLGRGNTTTAAGAGTGAGVPATDLLNATRPAGGGSALNAVGSYERANTWTKETATVQGGSSGLSTVGPGYQDFALSVAGGAAVTVSVYLRYGTGYTGTLPQLMVTNGAECGVADATATMSAAANTWQQLSQTFTPAADGIVTIRLLSNDTSGTATAYADTFTVT